MGRAGNPLRKPDSARMSALRPTPLQGLLLLVAGLALLLLIGLGTASAATVTVRSGDTLGAIAARNGTSVAALARANGIADPDTVHAGTRLRLPGTGTSVAVPGSSAGGAYTVRPGDTLGAIAARHGTSVGALAAASGITDPDVLTVGRRLTVPGGGAGATSGMVPVGTGGGGGGYTVRSGDTLGGIAARHGTTARALAALNGIRNPDVRPSAAPRTARRRARAVSAPIPSTQVSGAARPLRRPARRRPVARARDRLAGEPLDPERPLLGRGDRRHAADAGHGALVRPRGPRPAARPEPPGGQHRGRRRLPRVAAAAVRRHAHDDRRLLPGARRQRTRGPFDDTRDYIASVLSFRGTV